MKLTQILACKGFVITAEVGPPKGADPAAALAAARAAAQVADAVNITDGQGAVMRMSPLGLGRLLVEDSITPVWQVTCRDRNRIALQADLLAAYALGIRNVLVVTGDHMIRGDHPDAKAVFDLDSVQLLRVAGELNRGQDMAGQALDSAPDLCLGAVVAPEADNLELQLVKMRKKVDAGAQFFQTQAVFEPARFERFMARAAPLGAPVLAGIIPVRSPRMARFMNARIPGVEVPTWIIQRLNEADPADLRAVALEIAGQIAAAVAPCCQGLHIMVQGWGDALPAIAAAAGRAG
ncbi:MAG: methylenetetrahydrofolate reductase [Armatimonadota bacterium]